MTSVDVFVLFKVFKNISKPRVYVGVYATEEAALYDKKRIKLFSMDDPNSYDLVVVHDHLLH